MIALIVSYISVIINEKDLVGNRLTEAGNEIAAEKNTTLRRPVLLTMILQMFEMSSLSSRLDTSSVSRFPKKTTHPGINCKSPNTRKAEQNTKTLKTAANGEQ